MPEESALRAKAREVIRTGKLPNRRPDRTWGGAGIGAPCTVCGEPVTKDQLDRLRIREQDSHAVLVASASRSRQSLDSIKRSDNRIIRSREHLVVSRACLETSKRLLATKRRAA
jgi:hypothetical protein